MSSRRSRSGGIAEADHVQTEVEILAEATVLDRRLELLVGRRDDPAVDRDRAGPADALELARLEEVEELRLQARRDVPDLVEEGGSARGRLDPPLLAGDRAGEGPLLVAEEGRLDQLVREGDAIDVDERTRGRGGSGGGSSPRAPACRSRSRPSAGSSRSTGRRAWRCRASSRIAGASADDEAGPSRRADR